MALHRDIHWIGRQWAVTGYGMQAVDQKRAGQFDIEIARLWDDDLVDRLSGQPWFNAEDFGKGLAIARKRFPEPPGKSAPAPPPIVEPPPVAVPPPPIVTPPPPPAAEPPPLPIVAPPPNIDAPAPRAVEVPKPETEKPAPQKPDQPLPQDLLDKWFVAYGIDKNAPAPARAPAPTIAAPLVQEIGLPKAAPAPQIESLPISVGVASPEPAKTESSAARSEPVPPVFEMRVAVRAKFVRARRVQINSIQSYRLWVPGG
jgi:hypothetical protein